MTTYAWPNTRQFTPQLAELRVVDSLQRVHESPLSGYTQTQSMPGARWGWGYTFPDQESADRQAMEAYLLRLSGREHRVQLWDHKRPRPRGSIALSGVTMGATAAQFATSLTLAGCRAVRNVLLNSSFEIDTNADGLADGWTLFVGGAGDGARTISKARVTYDYNVIHGSYAQYVEITGAGNSNDTGIVAARVAVLPSTTYTLSAYMYCSDANKQYLLGRQFKADNTTQTGSDANTAYASTSVMERKSVTFTTQADAAFLEIVVRGITAVGQSMRVDAVQLEDAAAATAYAGYATLLAGDWLGLATGQLVRVVADATATDAGAMTVEVRHMLRQATTSGSAVTLDRPTALYMRAESGLIMPRQPGNAEPGLAVDFVEAFA